MKTKEEVQREVEAVNKLVRTSKAKTITCRACDGIGFKYFPVYGDWALGAERERCFSCNGTGNQLRFKE
jgi:hypothetical protein